MIEYTPFWGTPTSNIDWCEQNYSWTPFIAEFYNSLSNFPLVALGIFGCWKSLQEKKVIGAHFLAYFCLFIIGLGSFMFHATLKYVWQLADELPMILCCLVVFYLMLDVNNEISKYPLRKKIVVTTLTLYGIATIWMMAIYANSPLPMNLSFVLMIIFIFFRSLQLVFTTNDVIMKRLYILSLIASFSAGFAWIIEKTFCGSFTLTEYLHAYWHIGAGLGSFYFVTWAVYVKAYLAKFTKSPKGNILPRLQHSYGLIPYVVIVEKMD